MYPVNKSVLKSRIVSVQLAEPTPSKAQPQPKIIEPGPTRITKPSEDASQSSDDGSDKSEVGLLTGNQELLSLPGPSTKNPHLALPGPSSSAKVAESVPSPMKKLRNAILNTISPPQSSDVKAALKYSKEKRRRVQGSCREVLTSNEVEQRLKEEEEARKQKTKGPTAALGKRIKQEKADPNVIKEKKSKCAKKLFQQAKSEDEDDGPNLARSLKNDIGLTIGSWVSIHYQSECSKTVKEYRGQVTAQDLRNKDR